MISDKGIESKFTGVCKGFEGCLKGKENRGREGQGRGKEAEDRRELRRREKRGGNVPGEIHFLVYWRVIAWTFKALT